METILIIEDDDEQRNDLRQFLIDEGFAVATAGNWEEAEEYLANIPAKLPYGRLDLVVADIHGVNFPLRTKADPEHKKKGEEWGLHEKIVEDIRGAAKSSFLPIAVYTGVLTKKSDELKFLSPSSRVEYITKGDHHVLLERIRRLGITPFDYEFGPFRLDSGEQKLFEGDKDLRITNRSLQILQLLIGRSLKRDKRLKHVSSSEFCEKIHMTEEQLRVEIFKVRSVLGDTRRDEWPGRRRNSGYIRTERYGYSFKNIHEFGPFRLDFRTRSLYCKGDRVGQMEEIHFRILRILIEYSCRAETQNVSIDTLRRNGVDIEAYMLRTYIEELRQILGDNHERLIEQSKEGYHFVRISSPDREIK